MAKVGCLDTGLMPGRVAITSSLPLMGRLWKNGASEKVFSVAQPNAIQFAIVCKI
jgi:hypothetical protein